MEGDLDGSALAAARAVGNAHGLAQAEATVIHSRSNVVVHLRPAPVVARVMTGTVALHDDPEKWLEREVSVLRFLAPSGVAVAPSSLIAPGPHQHDGLWMTFSEWIPDLEPRRPPEDAHRLGQALRTLHDELRTFTGDLADLRALQEDIERLHGQLEPADAVEAAKITSLRARLDALDEAVFTSTLPTQALHGDPSLSNLLHTPQRLVWNDFEDTFRGPLHWDVAGFLISLQTLGGSTTSVRRMLDAYGWDDEQGLAPFIAAHTVYDEIWQMYDTQRRGARPPKSQTTPSSNPPLDQATSLLHSRRRPSR